MSFGNGLFYNGVSGASGLFLKLDGSNSPMTGNVDFGNNIITKLKSIDQTLACAIGDLSSAGNSVLLLVSDNGNIISLNAENIKSQGGFIITYNTILNANYVLLASDYYLSVTGITAIRTITLPTSSAGTIFIIKANSTAVLVAYLTVVGAGGETFDNAPNSLISTPYGSKTYVFDGISNWESS